MYRTANKERALTLIMSETSDPVPVLVTFNHPMPIQDAKKLVQATQIAADYWTIAYQREDGARTAGTFPKDVPADLKAVTNSEGQVQTVLGVMVIKGVVPSTAAGLGALLDDPRVYIADISEHVIAKQIAEDYTLSRFPLDAILVKTPFWTLDW